MSIRSGMYEQIDVLRIDRHVPEEVVKIAPSVTDDERMMAECLMIDVQSLYVTDWRFHTGNDNIMFGVPRWGKDNDVDMGEHWTLTVAVYEQRGGDV